MNTVLFSVDRIQPTKTAGAIKAFATLRIADVFVVRNIRIIEGKNGLFVAMPSDPYTDKSTRERKYADIAFPVTKEAHQQVQEAVLNAYAQQIRKNN